MSDYNNINIISKYRLGIYNALFSLRYRITKNKSFFVAFINFIKTGIEKALIFFYFKKKCKSRIFCLVTIIFYSTKNSVLGV